MTARIHPPGRPWGKIAVVFVKRSGKLLKAFLKKLHAIQSRIPILRHLEWNFITLHYVYVILWSLIGSVVVYGGSGIPYIDALFFATGAATQSGLNTIDFNLVPTYAQVFLYIISMLTNPIVMHSFVVFVRLYWFEKRFEHIARDARALRRSKSRTLSRGRDQNGRPREEQSVRGQSIVVLRNEAGDARDALRDDLKADVESSSESSNDEVRPRFSDAVPPRLRHADSEGSELRLPPQRSAEHHIAFLEHQRKDKGTLRIPSPREYDRGGMPQPINEENSTTSPEPQNDQDHGSGEGGDNITTHITINEPDVLRLRSRTTATMPGVDSRRDDPDEPPPNFLTRMRSHRPTFDGIVRSLTQEREREMPYLSWNATIGRNSAFVALTEEQREELGGIEYRALKTLAVVLVCYFVFFHVFGVICLVPWIMNSKKYGQVVTSVGQGRPWWGLFTAESAFNDVGFTLTPDSMASFQDAIYPLLIMSFLIVIGNTGFPCMLRLIIWMLSKIVPRGHPLWEELQFLLDHPRRCFTLLFPRNATWWLFAILVILNGVDLIFFIILDLNNDIITSLPPGIRILNGLFQAVCTRTAGFSSVSIAELHPAIQVSYMLMMYISVFPIAISMRRTNVYEERSLGIYHLPEDDKEDEEAREPSYIGAHLRKQLSFDLWYIFLGFFIICIVEGDRLDNEKQYAFTLFSVLFEIVSAYGTVGLSLGYPGVNTSFSSQFRTISKLVIIAMQVRGRHRGLPYALDRAILLPSESLNQKEEADAERILRRRISNVSNGSAGLPTAYRTGTDLSRNRTYSREREQGTW